jgi:hypothetical protein
MTRPTSTTRPTGTSVVFPTLVFVVVEGFALALRCLGKLTRGLALRKIVGSDESQGEWIALDKERPRVPGEDDEAYE